MRADRIETRHKRIDLADAIPLCAPFTMRIDPCGACIFKCKFCPCNQTAYKAAERHQYMAWEVFQRILDGMKEWADRDTKERPGQELSLKVVDFHGFGEPLLNKRLPDMIRAVKESSVCREIRLITNGYLMTPEVSQQLIDAGLDLCRVSVYALEREDYRNICGIDADPDRIVHNIAEFYRRSQGTGSHISAKIVSTALRTKEDELRFHQIYDGITHFSFVEEVGEIWPEFDIGESNDGDHIRGTDKAYRKYMRAGQRMICTIPFSEMQIHADGAVSPCSCDWARKLCYGNVMEESLDSMWHGEKLKKFWIQLLDRSAYTDLACATCMTLSADNIDRKAEEISARLQKTNVG